MGGARYFGWLVVALGLSAVGACAGEPTPDSPTPASTAGPEPLDAGHECMLDASCPDAETTTGDGGHGGGEEGDASATGGAGGGCSGPASCGDGDACTDDVCAAGQCMHDAVNTDDGDACTVDACDPAAGVSHVPVNADDGDACTVDACDILIGVSHIPADTDDGDATTPRLPTWS